MHVKKKGINSYSASLIVSYLAEKLVAINESFCFETVMSHPSKIKMLEAAKSAGYNVYLYFVYTNNPSLNIWRIYLRVKQGGHNVAVDRIKDRFKKSFNLLSFAVKKADRVFLIDNSDSFNVVEEKRDQKIRWFVDKIPVLFKKIAKEYSAQ